MSDYARPFDDNLGDASGVSPYSASEFSQFLYDIGDFVIVDRYDSSSDFLGMTSSATTGSVDVSPGKAVVKGHLYINDAITTLTFDAAANNRIDRIVLRSSGFQVRLTIIKGVAAANPAPPNLTANDMLLGWVWINSGFNPAVNSIGNENIHDDRIMFPTGEDAYLHNPQNLLHNSEFIAYSDPGSGASAPEGWRLFSTPTSVTGVALLANQPRGRAIQIQSGAANRGIQTQVRVSKGWYTLFGTVYNTTFGSGVRLRATSGTDRVKSFNRTGAIHEFVIRGYTGTSEELEIYLYGLGATSDNTFGQLLLSQGFVTGYFRHQHETIMLNNALTDASWTATAKSTGTTLIDLSASFGSIFGAETPIRGVILRMEGNDSGSAAGVAGMYTALDSATPLSRLYLTGEVNDVKRDTLAFVPMIGGLGYTFYLGITATGVNTFDATVEIIGIIT